MDIFENQFSQTYDEYAKEIAYRNVPSENPNIEQQAYNGMFAVSYNIERRNYYAEEYKKRGVIKIPNLEKFKKEMTVPSLNTFNIMKQNENNPANLDTSLNRGDQVSFQVSNKTEYKNSFNEKTKNSQQNSQSQDFFNSNQHMINCDKYQSKTKKKGTKRNKKIEKKIPQREPQTIREELSAESYFEEEELEQVKNPLQINDSFNSLPDKFDNKFLINDTNPQKLSSSMIGATQDPEDITADIIIIEKKYDGNNHFFTFTFNNRNKIHCLYMHKCISNFIHDARFNRVYRATIKKVRQESQSGDCYGVFLLKDIVN